MQNKILIMLIVPEIDEQYNIFIPINRRIGSIINLLNSAINELTDGRFVIKEDRYLYNRNNAYNYHINDIVRETDIRNGTQLVFI